MRVDQLMNAIEEIDDRYIEESAYGVRRKRNIPWGMIITAACFCMVIGATMFMQSLGILPHLNGTEGTTQPTTPSTTDSSEPTVSQPTVVLPPPERLFTEKESVHNEALYWIFGGEGNVQYYYLLGHGALGRDTELTEQEKKLLDSKLHYGIDHSEVWRLTPEQIENAFWSVYGLTWEQVMANFHPGSYSTLTWTINAPVYLEETGCYYGYYYDRDHEGIEIADVETEYFDDGTIHMYYTAVSLNEQRVAELRPYATGYHLLSNRLVVRYEEPTNPSNPVETRSSVEELFCDRGSWHNIALASFKSPQEIYLGSMFSRTYSGEPVVLTDYEQHALKELLDGAGAGQITRYTAEQIDEVLLLCFNKTAEELGVDLESHFTYLKETNCYYGLYWGTPGVRIENVRTEECEDGTISLYYTYGGNERLVKLQPHETGYYILSNEPYVDNTGKSEDQIAMETLFKGSSWYNRALACEYNSPKEMNLRKFFYSGIKGEPQDPTDQEREPLEKLGINLNYDLMRLPVDKMNEVLIQYFGITLADMEPEAFSGLVYLESTNCYYHSTSGWLGVDNFEALSVERMDDGRILVRYPEMEYEYVVTLRPHGDSYQVISNVLAEPFRPYAVDAAQLEALFKEWEEGSLSDAREKEMVLPLLGTFLEEPEMFVQTLGKQQRWDGAIHIFNRRVQYVHPRYSAYIQTIRTMLSKVQSEEEKRVIYRMAFYSGLGNFLHQTPDAQDYALLFDMTLYSDAAFSESCSGWLKQYCMADPEAFTAAMAQTEEENWEFYAQRSVSVVAATQEERLQIKESMNELVAELSVLDGYGIYDQIQCAKMIIEMCDKPIG